MRRRGEDPALMNRKATRSVDRQDDQASGGRLGGGWRGRFLGGFGGQLY